MRPVWRCLLAFKLDPCNSLPPHKIRFLAADAVPMPRRLHGDPKLGALFPDRQLQPCSLDSLEHRRSSVPHSQYASSKLSSAAIVCVSPAPGGPCGYVSGCRELLPSSVVALE